MIPGMEETRRYRLKQLAVVKVTGEQCNAFLQGQVSSDLRQLTNMRAQLSSVNSAKGRVLAIPHLARLENDVLMVMALPIAQNIVDTLTKFILRAKVSIAVDPGLACVGIAGPRANDALEKLGGGNLQSDWACTVREKWVAWRVPGDFPRIIIAGDTKTVEQLYNSMSDLPPGDIHSWRLHDMLAKLPEILPVTQDKFVAQMLQLDELGAVDFDKGCYTGQEIIARARYLGKVKRLPAVGATPGKRPLKPAEVLTVDGTPAAIVVSAAPHPEGGQSLLAVVNGEFPPATIFSTEDGMEINLAVGGDPSAVHSLTLRFLS